jgi:hypothetical protein
MLAMLAVAFALIATMLSAAYAAAEQASGPPVVVRDVVVDAQRPGTIVWIKTSRQPRFVGTLIDNPPRLVIDLTEATFAWSQARLPVRGSDIKEVRGSQFRKGVARVVIELVRKTSYSIEPDKGGLRVVIGQTPMTARREPRPERSAAPEGSSAAFPLSTEGRPHLQGIVIGDGGAVAYIQNPRTKGVAAYRVGDTLGTSVLETIEEDRVVLRGPNETFELRIAPLPRKKP